MYFILLWKERDTKKNHYKYIDKASLRRDVQKLREIYANFSKG